MSKKIGFSKELIVEIQEYFKKAYEIELTDEKAEEYLKAIAEFWLAFIEK